MIKDFLFYEQLGWIEMWNNAQEFAFLDLFAEGKACFSTNIEITRYIFSARGNSDNYNLDKSDNNKIAAAVKENDIDENMGGGLQTIRMSFMAYKIKNMPCNLSIVTWKCQQAVSRTMGATLHSNCHSFAAKLPNILLLIKHMTKDSLFHEQLGQTEMRNNV